MYEKHPMLVGREQRLRREEAAWEENERILLLFAMYCVGFDSMVIIVWRFAAATCPPVRRQRQASWVATWCDGRTERFIPRGGHWSDDVELLAEKMTSSQQHQHHCNNMV
jgi:hypothetical protein